MRWDSAAARCTGGCKGMASSWMLKQKPRHQKSDKLSEARTGNQRVNEANPTLCRKLEAVGAFLRMLPMSREREGQPICTAFCLER